MSVTPETDKTVAKTGEAAPGPTPKNEFKKPAIYRQHFMSPTDAMVSPCTQKLQTSRRMPRKPMIGGHHRPKHIQSAHHTTSKLANKENERKAVPEGKPTPPDSMAPQVPKPLETNV